MPITARSGGRYFVNVNRTTTGLKAVPPPGELDQDQFEPDSVFDFEEHIRIAKGEEPDPPDPPGTIRLEVQHGKRLTGTADAVPSAIRACRRVPSAE